AYREQTGGPLTFGRAFSVGILITLISCACYVATWEVIYFKLRPNFSEQYANYAVERARAAGATPAAVEETRRQMAEFKKLYDNPVINAGMTFVEPFPIGLVITLISAAVLRRKGRP